MSELKKSKSNTVAQQCLTTPSGEDYIGHSDHTVSGTLCQRWSDKSPHQHAYDDVKYFADYRSNPSATMYDVANYCRNPSVLSFADAKPWCFTTSEHVEAEYCDIPICKGKCISYDYAKVILTTTVFISQCKRPL